jgi:predicted HAD superfamily Cof-like phosphohydrolase
MTNEQLLVKEWMKNFRQNTPDSIIQLDEETAKLRAALILEEAFETITKGLGLSVHIPNTNPDVAEINEANLKEMFKTIEFYKEKEVDNIELADGLADLHVVGYCGTGVAAGIDMEPIFKEVQRSNDSKLWQEKELPIAVANAYNVEKISQDKYLVKSVNGKVIKSPTYSSAAIESKLIIQRLESIKNV